MVFSAPEGGVGAAQGYCFLEETEQVGVPLALVPREGPPAQRVFAADHAYLVAIVNARRARENHLKQGREAQRRLVLTCYCYVAGGIVAVEQIELHLGHLTRIQLQQSLDLLREHFGGDSADG